MSVGFVDPSATTPVRVVDVKIRGASEHNLKSVDVEIGDGLTVVTGLSGSGKTSLVFDTMYHEARRRFLNVFSKATQSARLAPANVQSITGIGPAIAVGQNLLNRKPLSTLATASGLHPFLRIDRSILGRETREEQNVGFGVARIIGVEPHSGYLTYFAKFDLALILDLCWRIGANRSDERVAELVDFIRKQQGPYGLWEYVPHPEASRWVTFDLLRSLSRLDDTTEWISLEPRTPFAAYPKRPKRF